MNSDQLKQTARSRRNNAQKVHRPSLKIGDKVVRGSSGGGRSSGIIQSYIFEYSFISKGSHE